MCFDLDSLPPIPVIARRRGLARGSRARGGRRQPLRRVRRHARRAGRDRASSSCPDVRGLYRFYEELALRFAERGYAAVAIDYFGRTAGVGKRDDDFPYTEHVAQTTPGGHPGRRRRRGRATSASDGADVGLHGRLLLRRPQLVARGGRRPRARRRGRLLRRRRASGTASPARRSSRGRDRGADPRAPGRRRPEHHRRAQRGLRRGALRRRRRARARRLRRRAAQLLRPHATRSTPRRRPTRGSACSSSSSSTLPERRREPTVWTGLRMSSAPPVLERLVLVRVDRWQRQLVDRRRLGQVLGVVGSGGVASGSVLLSGCLSCSFELVLLRGRAASTSSSRPAAA